MNLIAGVIGLAVVVEYLTEGIKKLVPAIQRVHQERLVALVLALGLCALLPEIRTINLGALSRLGWAESVIVALVVSRGSSAVHELLTKLGVLK